MERKNTNNIFVKIYKFFENYKYLVQVLHGMLLTLAFHPFDIFIVIPVSFSGFLFYIESTWPDSKDNRFKFGFKHGFAFFFGHFITSLYWLAIPLFTDLTKYWFLIPFAVTLPQAILASFYGVASGIICKILLGEGKTLTRIRRVYFGFAYSFGFFVAEILRSHLIVPFPWNLLGYASGYSLALMQFASVVGVYGLSLLLYFVGTIPYTRNPLIISAMTLVVVLITANGRAKLNQMSFDNKRYNQLSLYIVQPNISNHHKVQPLTELNKLKTTIDSIPTSKDNRNFKLILLPESAIPFTIKSNQEFIFDDIMSKHGNNTFLIAGVDTFSKESNEYFNSMIIVNNTGEIIDSYNKIILAPFGEYVPGSSLIRPIVSSTNSFAKGKRARSFRIYNNFSEDGLVIMPTICFESIFSPIADNRYTIDLDIIVNITNDSWLGNSIGPYQHLAIARMRAIEYGVPLIRVAKTGVSAVFNSYGKLLRGIPLDTEAVMLVDMPENKTQTTYMKILNFFRRK
jgi:apolipoprotein N-acyltransferase